MEHCFEYQRGTTEFTKDKEGNSLETYCHVFNFEPEDLAGLTVLDLGSGKTERFSRELAAKGLNTRVISINPDYAQKKARKTMLDAKKTHQQDPNHFSIAAIGEQLPLADSSIDKVYSLNALTFYSDPEHRPANVLQWASEIARTIKPTGEAVLGPCPPQQQANRIYKQVISLLTSLGCDILFEPIDHPDLVKKYPSARPDKWPTRMIIRKMHAKN